MGFKAAPLQRADEVRRPQRAPDKARPQASPTRAPSSHDFPSAYEHAWSDDWAAPAPAPAAQALDPRLERLIELACSELGCSPEELESLKDSARERRDEIESFCQRIFDERIRPRREKPDWLAQPMEGYPVAFWLEGQAGRAVARAPADSVLAVYAGGKIELYHPSSTPFAQRHAALQAAREARADGEDASPMRASEADATTANA